MDPLPLLKALVSTDSVNPSLVPGAAGEAAAGDLCVKAMKAAGLTVTVQPVHGTRSNVIGVLEGRTPGRTMMFCGHIDTVGVTGMTDPFVPRVDGDRLYGRGAQDMKGGVAAMIAAAAVLATSGTRGRVVVAAVVDEEHESAGAEALAREWRADAAIITEPTDLRLAIAHKGFAWTEIVTRGVAAHGSRPAEGRDAILRMGRVLAGLEALDRGLQSRPPIPLQGTGSLHASTINGGRELSSYPDRCVLQMERRTVSGETDATVIDEVRAILDEMKHCDPECDASATLMLSRPAYSLDPSCELVTACTDALRRAGRAADPVGMSFWTDAAILGAAGIPTVLLGPGGAGLHSLTEYVRISDVYACRDLLVDMTTRFVDRG